MSYYENFVTIGYDLDVWNNYGTKQPIEIDTYILENSHTLLCGMSGSGKSYALNSYFAKIIVSEKAIRPESEYYFADYKGDDSFTHLRNCAHYYSYKNTVDALEIVHSALAERLCGNDPSRHPITLIWDEYMANILALQRVDKKKAEIVMNKISEILLMGRAMAVNFITSMQRPDAIAFPAGSRLNYGVVVILGAAVKSIYEMLMPDFLQEVKGRRFGRGEGVMLLQGKELKFIKIPVVKDADKVREICIEALI